MVGAGLLTKSPNLTASGVGLILHDRHDSKKWFTGDKLNREFIPTHNFRTTRKFKRRIIC